MLRLDFQNIEELESLHYDAVEDYVKGLSGADQDRIYGCVIQLSGFENFPKKSATLPNALEVVCAITPKHLRIFPPTKRASFFIALCQSPAAAFSAALTSIVNLCWVIRSKRLPSYVPFWRTSSLCAWSLPRLKSAPAKILRM